MHVEDAIGTEQIVKLWANWRYIRSRYKRIQLYRTDFQEVSWRYIRSRYKRIQLYRTDFQEVSGPIRIKL